MKDSKPQVNIVVVFCLLLIFSSCAGKNPLITATPEQLKQYQTSQLSEFELKHGRNFDPEISQELNMREKEDFKYLIQNAVSLEDFESVRYPFQTETLASKIQKKYDSFRPEPKMFDDARRQWYIEKHPEISHDIRQCILNSESQYRHNLKIGMTDEQVIAAIGFPDSINSSTGSWGSHEQWVYGGVIGNTYFPVFYFYFLNEKLESFQN